jgi:hypothetical protein
LHEEQLDRWEDEFLEEQYQASDRAKNNSVYFRTKLKGKRETFLLTQQAS